MNLKEKMMKQLKDRVRQQSNSQGGVVEGGVFKQNLDVPFWKCGEGDHEIDIIPYEIGENDPRLKKFDPRNEYNVGDIHYVLQLYVHSNVGPANDTMLVCLSKNFNQPCPICQHVRKLQKEGADEGTIKALIPSRYPRAIYNVVVYTNGEESKGVQVWHTSSYLMEQYISKLASGSSRKRGEYIYFPDPVNGKSIGFTRQGTSINTKFIAHRFIDRNYEIEDDILKSAHCLDDLIQILSYEQMYEIFWGEKYDADESEQETTRPRVERGRVAQQEAPEEETAPENEDEPEPISVEDRIKGMKRKQLLEFIEENEIDCEDIEEDIEDLGASDLIDIILDKMDATPPKKETRKPVASKPSRKTTKKQESKSGETCPSGFEFGVSCDEQDECEDCPRATWEACSLKAEEIAKAKRAAAKARR